MQQAKCVEQELLLATQRTPNAQQPVHLPHHPYISSLSSHSPPRFPPYSSIGPLTLTGVTDDARMISESFRWICREGHCPKPSTCPLKHRSNCMRRVASERQGGPLDTGSPVYPPGIGWGSLGLSPNFWAIAASPTVIAVRGERGSLVQMAAEAHTLLQQIHS